MTEEAFKIPEQKSLNRSMTENQSMILDRPLSNRPGRSQAKSPSTAAPITAAIILLAWFFFEQTKSWKAGVVTAVIGAAVLGLFVLDLVHHLVQALAQQDDVLPLNGGDERAGQHVGKLVLFAVGGVLHLVQTVQFLVQMLRVKVFEGFFQVMRSLAGAGGAGDKVIEIEGVLLF